MNFIKSNRYDINFVKQNMMGPNSMKTIEELSESLYIERGMRVLDLGCGKGLTSIFLAKEYGVTVFATDLWINATDNYNRFKGIGLEDKIIPIHAEAHNLPFAHEFFDVAVSIDAYHYFGAKEGYLSEHLAPLIKKGGQIAVSIPGIKHEFTNGIPTELLPYCSYDMNFHSCNWWRDLWEKSDVVSVQECKEMKCFKEAWQDWLSYDKDSKEDDIKMLEGKNADYFNLISIKAIRL